MLTKQQKFKTFELKNIYYQYDKKSDFSLENVNLSFRRGSKIVIIGKSGSGKSTLVKIISGLIKPTNGNIKFNGEIKEDVFNLWSNNLAYLPQEPFLFDDTIQTNIVLTKNQNLINYKRYKEIIKKSGLYEYICSLKNGDKKIIGDKGKLISGGQRQRISLARALYFGKNTLVLDEATTGVDFVGLTLVLPDFLL